MNKLFPIVFALLFFGCDDYFKEDVQQELQALNEDIQQEVQPTSKSRSNMLYKGVSIKFPNTPEQYHEKYDYISYPINVWFTSTYNGAKYTVHFSNSELIDFYDIRDELLNGEMLQNIEKNRADEYISQYKYIDSKKVLEYSYEGQYWNDFCHKDFVLNSDTYVQIEVRGENSEKAVCNSKEVRSFFNSLSIK